MFGTGEVGRNSNDGDMTASPVERFLLALREQQQVALQNQQSQVVQQEYQRLLLQQALAGSSQREAQQPFHASHASRSENHLDERSLMANNPGLSRLLDGSSGSSAAAGYPFFPTNSTLPSSYASLAGGNAFVSSVTRGNFSQPANQLQYSEQTRAISDVLPGAINALSLEGPSNFNSYGGSLKAFLELQEAINLIPEEAKKDYLEALEAVPDLVLSESDAVRFLRFRDFNAQVAAWDLVRYWKTRREIFRERAFLPMTMTGDGALTEEDIEVIKTGYFMILPNDNHRRTVCFYDPAKRPETMAIETRMRVSFYWAQVITENDSSQSEGYVSIILVNNPKYDADYPKIAHLVVNTFPSKYHSSHVFDVRTKSRSSPFPYWFVKFLVGQVGRLFASFQLHIHPQKPSFEVIQDMEAHGLTRAGLPSTLGGWFDNESFKQWMEARMKLERERYSLPNLTNDSAAAGQVDAMEVSVRANLPPAVHHPSPRRMGEDSELHHDSKPSAASPKRRDVDGILSESFARLNKEMEGIPNADKSEYLEALKKALPQVWEEESNPELFLRVERSDAHLAAQRLARYWRLRSQSFGAKKFGALSQTGEDALGRKDLSVLGTAFLKLLPNDPEGSPVLWIDPARVQKGSVAQSRDRCLFYMFSILTENEVAQTEGAVLLLKLGKPPFERMEVSYLESLAESLPIRFKAIHLLSHEPISASVKSQIKFGDNVYVHVATTKDDLAAKLVPFGMTQATLPRCLNGEWGYSKFVQWQELRTRVEWKIPLGLSGREKAVDFPAIKHYTTLPDEQKAERSRRLNVIHCRRKRDRILIETTLLQEQCEMLQDDRAKMLDENRQLEELYKEVTAKIACTYAEMEKEDSD